jgi:hypothetical protein
LEDMRPTSVVAVKKEHTPTAVLGVASSDAEGGRRRRQTYAEGSNCGVAWGPSTPTTPIFGRRRRGQQSALSAIPVVASDGSM